MKLHKLTLKQASSFLKTLPVRQALDAGVFSACLELGFERWCQFGDSKLLAQCAAAAFDCNAKSAATKRTYSGARVVEYVELNANLKWNAEKRSFRKDGQDIECSEREQDYWTWLDAVAPVVKKQFDADKRARGWLNTAVAELDTGNTASDARTAELIATLRIFLNKK